MLRKFARKSAWPLIYEHEVRALDRDGNEVQEKVHVLLIHEILAELARFSDLDSLTCTDGMELRSQTHFGKALRELALPREKTAAAGLWVDGVPYTWGRAKR